MFPMTFERFLFIVAVACLIVIALAVGHMAGWWL